MSYVIQARYPEDALWLCIFNFIDKKDAVKEKDKRELRFKGIEYRVRMSNSTCECGPCTVRRERPHAEM